MSDEKEIDTIFLGLVPKIVDSNPNIFADDAQYWDHALGEVNQFFGRIPKTYTAGRKETVWQDKKGAIFACEKSPCDLKIGFKLGYHLLLDTSPSRLTYTLDDCIACPQFDLVFKPSGKKSTTRILQAALEQFYLLQGDLDNALIVFGFKNEKIAQRGLKLLESFLPKGTTIKARCNYGAGNGHATYRL